MSDATSFKWATVMAVNPIAIRLDGDSLALGLIPDSLVDPQSLSVGDRVRVELSIRKVVIHGVSDGSGTPAGKIDWFATPNAPQGWMLCQGQSLSRVAYPRLYAAIGVAYGATDAASFSLPDARGRMAVAVQPGMNIFDTIGKKGGDIMQNAAIGAVNNNIGTIGYVATGIGGGRSTTSAYSVNVGNNIGGTSTFNHHTPVGGSNGDPTAMNPYIIFNCAIKL